VSKAHVRRWWKARELELRGLMWEWDPLELAGAPEDEYDCVVDELLSRLVHGASKNELVRLLVGQREHFGASLGSPAELDAFADRVLGWWLGLPPRPEAG
jgi:hypothetical protein